MQLYLIRHAQSENNALSERTGDSLGRNMDPELTDLGRSQAQFLARCLAQGSPNLDGVDDPHNRLGFGLTHLYSSLMVRAVATGCIIAHIIGLCPYRAGRIGTRVGEFTSKMKRLES